MRISRTFWFCSLALSLQLAASAAQRTYPPSDGGIVSVKITTVAAKGHGGHTINTTFVTDFPAYYKSLGMALPPLSNAIAAECDDDDSGGGTGSGGGGSGGSGSSGSGSGGSGSQANPALLPEVDAVPLDPPANTPGNVLNYTGSWTFTDGYSASKTWGRTLGKNGSQSPWQVTRFTVTPPIGRDRNGTQDCYDEDWIGRRLTVSLDRRRICDDDFCRE